MSRSWYGKRKDGFAKPGRGSKRSVHHQPSAADGSQVRTLALAMLSEVRIRRVLRSIIPVANPLVVLIPVRKDSEDG